MRAFTSLFIVFCYLSLQAQNADNPFKAIPDPEIITDEGILYHQNSGKKAGYAAKIIERVYTAPHLPQVSMEPHNFFAHVTEDRAELSGPVQAPEFTERAVAARLDMSHEQIHIHLARMGGGFGRRAYGHYAVEAAVISRQVNAPVKLVYTREDDVTFGVYRPAYHMLYRAALDADNNLIGLHVRGGGVPESPLHANRFPAGAVDNYLAGEAGRDPFEFRNQ